MEFVESVIDPPQPTLSKYVFAGSQLKADVRFKILRAWAQLNNIGPISGILIVGSIGTYNYTDESDIDITIKWAGDANSLLAARDIVIPLNGKQFAGPHEINYFIRPDIHPDYYDSIYDVLTNKWLKGPAEAGIDINRYLGRFSETVDTITDNTAELLNDIADYRALEHISHDDKQFASGMASRKLNEIDNDIKALGGQYIDVWSERRAAFDAPDIEELREYGRRNAMPDNVLYLLLRKYCYLHFLHALYELSDDKAGPSMVRGAENAYGDFKTDRIQKGFEESLRYHLR